MNKKQRGLVVQYRHLASHDIMIIENNESKRISEPHLTTKNLSDVLEQVIKADKNFAFFLVASVGQGVAACEEIISVLNASLPTTKGMHITVAVRGVRVRQKCNPHAIGLLE